MICRWTTIELAFAQCAFTDLTSPAEPDQALSRRAPPQGEERFTRYLKVNTSIPAVDSGSATAAVRAEESQGGAGSTRALQVDLLQTHAFVYAQHAALPVTNHRQGIDLESAVVQTLNLIEPVRLDELLREPDRLQFEAIWPRHADHAFEVVRIVSRLKPGEHVEQAVLG